MFPESRLLRRWCGLVASALGAGVALAADPGAGGSGASVTGTVAPGIRATGVRPSEPGVQGQDLTVVFSVDWHGPTVAAPDSVSGVPLTEADLLMVTPGGPRFGPLAPPTIVVSGAQLGLSRYSICSGHLPGTPCGIEVDALSFGRDKRLEDDAGETYRLFFTVDEYARGLATVPSPSIASESSGGDISADILVDHGLGPGPLPPAQGTHAIVYDGNGQTSATGFANFGLGLVEPNVPGTGLPGAASDLGDNIDALAIGYSPVAGDRVYFSLDEDFNDPRVTLDNSGTAGFEGVRGGDVLVHPMGGAGYALYASADQLGLDRLGVGSDDLDALAIAENGLPGYQPSSVPYDWVPGPLALHQPGPAPTDMLLFSVRRGSALIGATDSIQGLPIQEGDILTTPLPMGAGGLSAFPGIFIAAENLGMATRRGGGMDADDANGMSPADLFPVGSDCNGNGTEDSVDISCGASMDVNMNGIPDECEQSGTAVCDCDGLGPCGNDAIATGCATSTGSGASLGATGSSSVFSDDLVLTATGVPLNKSGLFYMGGSLINVPFGDGRRCVGSGGVGTRRFPVQNSGPSGTYTLGPGTSAFSCSQFPPPGCIDPGDTFHFQAWFRDPMGPCGDGFNLSSSWSVTFTP